jgi:predicted nucleic acid-binding protein
MDPPTDAVLVDSNIILDLFTNDPVWVLWSSDTLARMSQSQTLIINAVIYSEISLGFQRIEALDQALATIGVQVRPIPKEALFLAAKVFLAYRRRGGHRSSTLPDFFIGAHAAVANLPLITRDLKRYPRNFPTVTIISP